MPEISQGKTLPVSVIIPAYNRADLIERAIRSVQRQEPCPPAEIIVVDDASTDTTAEIARELGATVVVHKANKGAFGARNTAVAHASHDWLALLDSDDEWLPGHINRLWTRRADHVLVASSAVTDGAEPRRLIGHASGFPVSITEPTDLLFPVNPIPASGVLVRRDAVVAAGGFRDTPPVEDLDMWLRVLKHGSALACPEPGYRYFTHDAQISGDQEKMRRALRDMVARYEREPWWRPSILCDLDAQFSWDRARASAASGARPKGLSQFTVATLRRPSNLAVILEMLRARRRLRQRLTHWEAGI